MIYVGPDGEMSDRDLTDHEGPPSLHHYKPLTKNTSPWEDCETTRSLKRKLEAIENLDLEEEEEESHGKKTPTPDENMGEETRIFEKEPNIAGDAIENAPKLTSSSVQQNAIEPQVTINQPANVPCLQNVIEPNATEDQLDNIPSIQYAAEPHVAIKQPVNVPSFEANVIEDQPVNVPITKDMAEPKQAHTQYNAALDDDYFEELQELEFLEQTLEKSLVSDEEYEFQEKDFLPNFTEQPTFHRDDLNFMEKGQELTEKELKETAKYALSKTETLLEIEPEQIASLEEWNESSVDIASIMRCHKPPRIIHPIERTKQSKKSHTSKSSSSEASSSDAESIILPEKPCFSFMTCDAINDDSDNSAMKSIKRHSGSFIVTSSDGDIKYRYDVTAELIEACQPEGYFSEQGQCFVLEDQQSPDEFYYDDTELIWGEKEDDSGTITVLYSDERGQGIEKNVSRALSDDSLFPDLDKKFDNINTVDHDRQTEMSLKLADGASDSPDSDQDLPPRSPAMDTPMKLFYHLVPSPHSSSNEDLDDSQSTKVKVTAALSPIQECPSRESSLNRSTDSLSNELRDQNYNVLETAPNDIKINAIEREVNSPPSKYFRTVEHEQKQKPPGDKHELRGLIKRFVAEQLMEGQGISGDIKISRPQPRPAVERMTRGNRRCRVISPNDSANQDILLPPLKPHRRSMLDKARVIRSPKLGVRRDKDYGSDVVCYQRDYNDDSSDSSLTTKTEPWSSPVRPRPMHLIPTSQTPNVTFLGCETPTQSHNTKVVPVDNDSPVEASDESQEPKHSRLKHDRYQEFGYQSEPEVHKNRRERKRNERGYVSEGDRKNKQSDSFVTYDGSELSESEAETRRLHRSEPHVGRYGNLKRPAISREKINPKTPYAPQVEYKTRHQHHRSSHKIIYRLSGEFTTVANTVPTTGSISMSGISSSPNRRISSTSTVNSCTGMALGGSTSTVWILSEPAMSSEEMTADEHSVPGTPVSLPRGRRMSRLRLFR